MTVSCNFSEWLLHEEIQDARLLYSDLLQFLRDSSENLFVHFSQVPRGDMKLMLKPSHSDPIGIYAFPKKYVLDENASHSGWFGSPYIYVLKLSPTAKILNLSTLSIDDANDLLENMGIKEYTNRPAFRKLDISKGGGLLWHTMHAYISEKKLGNVGWNKLFAKAGNYDAVIDDGSGFIFSNEPYQICIINSSLIEVVKSLENPINLYQQKIWNSLYRLATTLGNKFFNSYKIESLKTGATDAFGSRYLKKAQLGNYRTLSYSVKSMQTDKPYDIKITYDNGNSSLRVGVHSSLDDYIEVFKKELEGKYESGMKILKNTNFDEFEKDIATEIVAKIPKESKSDVFVEMEKLHKKIISGLNIPNIKININPAEHMLQSISQISHDDTAFNCLVFIRKSSNPDQTFVMFKFAPKKIYGRKIGDRRSSVEFRFRFDTNPIQVPVDKIIADLKSQVEQKLQELENDSQSYIFYDYIIMLKLIVANMFKNQGNSETQQPE